jgi:hypothetical protein
MDERQKVLLKEPEGIEDEDIKSGVIDKKEATKLCVLRIY